MIGTLFTLKPTIPNPKEPFKVDFKQLAELDALIKERLPEAKLSEGCRFARWAEFDGIHLFKLSPFYDTPYDYNYEMFIGTICGKEKTIFMFLPYFD